MIEVFAQRDRTHAIAERGTSVAGVGRYDHVATRIGDRRDRCVADAPHEQRGTGKEECTAMHWGHGTPLGRSCQLPNVVSMSRCGFFFTDPVGSAVGAAVDAVAVGFTGVTGTKPA